MRPGPQPSPRRRLHPRLVDRVRSSATQTYMLGRMAGFPVGRELSYLINADAVAATPLLRKRLQLLANILGHPIDEIFAEDGEA